MGWYSDWLYCKKITIDNSNVDVNLTDFPLYVYINADTDIGGHVSDTTTGHDIRFTQSDGETLLKYERLYFNVTTGACTAHYFVKVPTVNSGSTTDIYIYYGKSGAADGEDATNVWDANFQGVWHLDESGDGSDNEFTDSTSNARHGTGGGAAGAGDGDKTPSQQTDFIYKCQQFDGTDDFIDCGDVIEFADETEFTIEVWLKRTNSSLADHLISHGDATSAYTFQMHGTDEKYPRFYVEGDGAADYATTNVVDGITDTTTWYHLAGVLDYDAGGDVLYTYKDGAEIDTDAYAGSGTIGSGATNLQFGREAATSGNEFIGRAAEIRISDTRRAVDWLKFTYHNLNPAGDQELSWGDEIPNILTISVSDEIIVGQTSLSVSESITVTDSPTVSLGDLAIVIDSEESVTVGEHIGAYISPINWQSYADKHVNSPVILISIDFNSGARYYSNEYVRTSSQLYKGNILELPHIKSSIGDIKRKYERDVITIIFNDSDYEFRGLEESETVSFKNRVVTISIAFQGNNYADPLLILTGYIYDWKRLDNLRYEFEIIEKSLNLDNKYPDKVVDRSDYANAHSSAIGEIIPIPYGTISAYGASNDGAFGHPSLTNGTGLLFVDTTTDSEKHLVGRQASGDNVIINVDRVYINGTLMTEGSGSDYTVYANYIDSARHTEIHWNAGVNPTEDNFISCDITVGDGLMYPSEVIWNFLFLFCDYAMSDFDIQSLQTTSEIEVERGYRFDGAFYEEGTLRTILDRWRNEFEVDIYWSKDGKITFNYLRSNYEGTINYYKDTTDILEFKESDPKVDEIINYLRYGYNYHYAKTYYYNYSTYQNTDSQTKYGATYKDFIGFQWIRDASMASDIAMRKILRFKNPIVFDTMVFPLKTFSDELTDRVHITHYLGSGSSGYDEKLFQIRQTEYNLDDFTNTMLLEDASNWVGTSCILGDGDSLAADWASATGSDRDYCYLCDATTGLFSDSEPGKQLFD